MNSRVDELHNQAMEKAEQALVAKRRGNTKEFESLCRQAHILESKAVNLLEDDLSCEPTRSVLCRSAAALALDCSMFREAENLIITALSGSPPAEIREELRELFERVQFLRHLSARGFSLDQDKFQLSMRGRAVSYGMASTREFMSRIDAATRLFFRTTERKMGIPYRDRRKPDASVQDRISLYMTVPQPGSFSVTIRLGRPLAQEDIFVPSASVIAEVFDCLTLYSDSDIGGLKNKISDQKYFLNFIGSARRIAPDGDDVQEVGFAAKLEGRERIVTLETPRKSLPAPGNIEQDREREQIDRVQGRLLYADAIKKKDTTKIVDENGRTWKVEVPEGMMNDIVRPLWDEEVVIEGQKRKGTIFLDRIDPAK